ncbi:hypothetical protein C8D87_11498 [Lentzea atacamensis]|uniref:Uncharacterized protein n=1 Tax=Lentzea atacamensis TaxID=531938 RepID=A0ABX9DW20_9PSEU|nr:hypothetical protein [Lentzea atacamensis]RAS59486.1 hypothetical protein C8D87_11498 [Lentzea atacamensis]
MTAIKLAAQPGPSPLLRAMSGLAPHELESLVRLVVTTEVHFDHDREPEGSAYLLAMDKSPDALTARGLALGLAADCLDLDES